MSNFTLSMVKTLLNRKLDLSEAQQRLIYSGSVIKDNKSLAYYNMDNASAILIVRRFRSGARTKATALLYNSHELDAVCSENSDINLPIIQIIPKRKKRLPKRISLLRNKFGFRNESLWIV